MRRFYESDDNEFGNKVIKEYFNPSEIRDMEDYVYSMDPDAYYSNGSREATSKSSANALLTVSDPEAAKEIIEDAKNGVKDAYRYCFYYSFPVLWRGFRTFNNILSGTSALAQSTDSKLRKMYYINTMYIAFERQIKNFNLSKVNNDKLKGGRTALDIFTGTISRIIVDEAKEIALDARLGGAKTDNSKSFNTSKMRKIERDALTQGDGDDHAAADSLLDKLDMEINDNDDNFDGHTSSQERDLFNSIESSRDPMVSAEMQNWHDCISDKGWTKNDGLRGSLLKTLVNDMITDPEMNGETAFLAKHSKGIKNRQTARNYLGMNPGGYAGETIDTILGRYDLDKETLIKKIVYDAKKNPIIREPVMKADGTQLMLPRDENDPRMVPIFKNKKPAPVPSRDEFDNEDDYNEAINKSLSDYEKVKKDSLVYAADNLLGRLPGNILTEALRRYCLRMAEMLVYRTDKIFRESIKYNNKKRLSESKRSRLSACRRALNKVSHLDESNPNFKRSVVHIFEASLPGGIRSNRSSLRVMSNLDETRLSPRARRVIKEVLR